MRLLLPVTRHPTTGMSWQFAEVPAQIPEQFCQMTGIGPSTAGGTSSRERQVIRNSGPRLRAGIGLKPAKLRSLRPLHLYDCFKRFIGPSSGSR